MRALNPERSTLHASPRLIGIAGGTGSGKSTVARRLLARFPGRACLLEFDSYYRDQTHLTLQERHAVNYDHPDAIEFDLLLAHLQALLRGETIARPRYCFATHNRLLESEAVKAQPVIVLEGLFALGDARLRQLMDTKLFVDAPADLRFIRRLQRDLDERGRSAASAVAQYLATVRPMHLAWVEPTRVHADTVIDNSQAPEELERVLDGIVGRERVESGE